MKKTVIILGSVLIVIITILTVVVIQNKSQKEITTDNLENTQNRSALLVSPQKEISVIAIDKVELSQPGFIAVHEVISKKPGQVVEVSQYLDIGIYENIEISLGEIRQAKFIDIGGEFPITNELVVVVYVDDGDKGFNPNLDSILEESGSVLARYVASGESAPKSVIVPGDQEKVSDVAVIVNYSDEGFSPNLVEINQGDVVEFVNQSSRPMWVASNSHPAHDVLSTFDQFTVSGFGESWQYSFDQKGEWKYHDHVNASIEGVVIVR
jgi:plastocyanin